MSNIRTLIVGHGGREAAISRRLSAASQLFAVMGHLNPTIVELCRETGGKIAQGDVCSPEFVAGFARSQGIELAVVSSDAPLEAGVVDALLAEGIPTVGPTRAGAEIEWNKKFCRDVLQEVAPDLNPRFDYTSTPDEVDRLIASFDGAPVVVKPQGLTGGKGVKVMGPHLASHDEAAEYAKSLLSQGDESIIIEEKIDGIEFTIQAITDGTTVVFPPATYDYPYLLDGDNGPGTGGMGCFTSSALALPFMTMAAYEKACETIRAVLSHLHSVGRHFSGVLNSGFFFTTDGRVLVIEFNARFGDPEALNIMAICDSDWTEVCSEMARGALQPTSVRFLDAASVVLYLVTTEYATAPPKEHQFSIDYERLRDLDVIPLFGSAEQVDASTYRTVGASRSLALVATGVDIQSAHVKVLEAAQSAVHGDGLMWRTDIGESAYIKSLCDKVPM